MDTYKSIDRLQVVCGCTHWSTMSFWESRGTRQQAGRLFYAPKWHSFPPPVFGQSHHHLLPAHLPTAFCLLFSPTICFPHCSQNNSECESITFCDFTESHHSSSQDPPGAPVSLRGVLLQGPDTSDLFPSTFLLHYVDLLAVLNIMVIFLLRGLYTYFHVFILASFRFLLKYSLISVLFPDKSKLQTSSPHCFHSPTFFILLTPLCFSPSHLSPADIL